MKRVIEDYIACSIVCILALLVVLSVSSCQEVANPSLADKASRIGDNEAIKAILGESLHDDKAMEAMAHALRNRDTLEGVYGREPSLSHVSGKLWQRASKAWFNSGSSVDITLGATNWLSDYDIKHAHRDISWRKRMIETLYVGQTHFYKERS